MKKLEQKIISNYNSLNVSFDFLNVDFMDIGKFKINRDEIYNEFIEFILNPEDYINIKIHKGRFKYTEKLKLATGIELYYGRVKNHEGYYTTTLFINNNGFNYLKERNIDHNKLLNFIIKKSQNRFLKFHKIVMIP